MEFDIFNDLIITKNQNSSQYACCQTQSCLYLFRHNGLNQLEYECCLLSISILFYI
jgi:hypothetical protein